MNVEEVIALVNAGATILATAERMKADFDQSDQTAVDAALVKARSAFNADADQLEKDLGG